MVRCNFLRVPSNPSLIDSIRLVELRTSSPIATVIYLFVSIFQEAERRGVEGGKKKIQTSFSNPTFLRNPSTSSFWLSNSSMTVLEYWPLRFGVATRYWDWICELPLPLLYLSAPPAATPAPPPPTAPALVRNRSFLCC
jgi:hypothetical protein